MKNLILMFLLLLVSCAGYVDRLHTQIDKEEARQGPAPQRADKFDMYRSPEKYARNPRATTRDMNSENTNTLSPVIRRDYKPVPDRKRYTADDLNDNSSGSSLWAQNSANDGSLFSNDQVKKTGDLILIKVNAKLKDELTNELKLVFPDKKSSLSNDKTKTDATAGADQTATKAAAPQAEDSAPLTNDKDAKVFDRISSVIVEEINRDHVLIKGRKQLMYKGEKHLIEIQAMIAKKDIVEEGAINSDNIIEKSLTVLR